MYYWEVMVVFGIIFVQLQDNDIFMWLMCNDSYDDWLKCGICSDVVDFYCQQDLNVILEYDFWGFRGIGGYFDLKVYIIMLQVDVLLVDGWMFFCIDLVNMDVGSFFIYSDGSYLFSWGICGEIVCISGSKNQIDSGVSVVVGWKNDIWSGDIGIMLMGFNVVDVVGGLSYSSDVGLVGYMVNVYWWFIFSLLFFFGGQKDSSSYIGVIWGGVCVDGGGLSLSYDCGEVYGIWFLLGVDLLIGKNVVDNWCVCWMIGYYYKVINENNCCVIVGFNNMIWYYDKDFSGYIFGQGGYYSLQEYFLFVVLVIWCQCIENWFWEFGGLVLWFYLCIQM